MFWGWLDITKYLFLFGLGDLLEYKNSHGRNPIEDLEFLHNNHNRNNGSQAKILEYIKPFKSDAITAFLRLANEFINSPRKEVADQANYLANFLINNWSRYNSNQQISIWRAYEGDRKEKAWQLLTETQKKQVSNTVKLKELNELISSENDSQIRYIQLMKADVLREEKKSELEEKTTQLTLTNKIKFFSHYNLDVDYDSELHDKFEITKASYFEYLLNTNNLNNENKKLIADYLSYTHDIDYLEKARKIYKELNVQDDRLLNHLGMIYLAKDQHDGALACLDEVKIEKSAKTLIVESIIATSNEEKDITLAIERLGARIYSLFNELSLERSERIWKQLTKKQKVDFTENGDQNANTFNAIWSEKDDITTEQRIQYLTRLAQNQFAPADACLEIIEYYANKNPNADIVKSIIDSTYIISKFYAQESKPLETVFAFIDKNENTLDNKKASLEVISDKLFALYFSNKTLAYARLKNLANYISKSHAKDFALAYFQDSTTPADDLQEQWNRISTSELLEIFNALTKEQRISVFTKINEEKSLSFINSLSACTSELIEISISSPHVNVKLAFLKKFEKTNIECKRQLARYYAENSQWAEALELLQQLSASKELLNFDVETADILLSKVTDTTLRQKTSEILFSCCDNPPTDANQNMALTIHNAKKYFSSLSKAPAGYESFSIALDENHDNLFYSAVNDLVELKAIDEKTYPKRNAIQRSLRDDIFNKLLNEAEAKKDISLATVLFDFYSNQSDSDSISATEKLYAFIRDNINKEVKEDKSTPVNKKLFAKTCFKLAEKKQDDSTNHYYLEAEKYYVIPSNLNLKLAAIYLTDKKDLTTALSYIKKSIANKDKISDVEVKLLDTLFNAATDESKEKFESAEILLNGCFDNKISDSNTLIDIQHLILYFNKLTKPEKTAYSLLLPRIADLGARWQKNKKNKHCKAFLENAINIFKNIELQIILTLVLGKNIDTRYNANLVKGFESYYGLNDKTKNIEQAAQYFYNAAENNSPEGCYWHAVVMLETRGDALKTVLERLQQVTKYLSTVQELSRVVMSINIIRQLRTLFDKYENNRSEISAIIQDVGSTIFPLIPSAYSNTLNFITTQIEAIHSEKHDFSALLKGYYTKLKQAEKIIALHSNNDSSALETKQQEPLLTKAYFDAGKKALKNKDNVKAKMYFTSASNSDYAFAKIELAKLEQQTKNYSEAITMLAEVIESSSHAPDDSITSAKNMLIDLRAFKISSDEPRFSYNLSLAKALIDINRLHDEFLKSIDVTQRSSVNTIAQIKPLHSDTLKFFDEYKSSLSNRGKSAQILMKSTLELIACTYRLKPPKGYESYAKSFTERKNAALKTALDSNALSNDRIAVMQELSMIAFFEGRGKDQFNRTLFWAYSAFLMNGRKGQIEDMLHPLARTNKSILKMLTLYQNIKPVSDATSIEEQWLALSKDYKKYNDNEKRISSALSTLKIKVKLPSTNQSVEMKEVHTKKNPVSTECSATLSTGVGQSSGITIMKLLEAQPNLTSTTAPSTPNQSMIERNNRSQKNAYPILPTNKTNTASTTSPTLFYGSNTVDLDVSDLPPEYSPPSKTQFIEI